MRFICAYATVGSNNKDLLDKTIKVMRYLKESANFGGLIIFTPVMPVEVPEGINFIQIPEIGDVPYGKNWQSFLLKCIPKMLLEVSVCSQFMFIHEDGFPINWDLWEMPFINHDYIAAPWEDGVVGGGGMSMKSRNFLEVVSRLPFYEEAGDGNNEDEFACRVHRNTLEQAGISFAPFRLAVRYCSEVLGSGTPSFGFHGRKHCPEKYEQGWKQINAIIPS